MIELKSCSVILFELLHEDWVYFVTFGNIIMLDLRLIQGQSAHPQNPANEARAE